MPKRKRAPGGGAKPKGPFKGKSATLTTRITPETREELELAAAEKGRSLSQEVEYRLRSFAGQGRKPPHIRSLADAVSLIVARIEQRTGRRWLDDPFTADAVRQGISAFSSRISPASTGPTPIPPQIEKYAAKMPSLGQAVKSPLVLAELEVEALIYAIENAPLSSHEMPDLSFPAAEGLSSIREHLGVGARQEKKR
jgi:hypothetical protein